MFAQEWTNIFDIVVPYPETPVDNYDEILVEKGYTPSDFFKVAEDFFTSIGLYRMTPSFWANSMFTKPKDREVVCHSSAYDFKNTFDYRLNFIKSYSEIRWLLCVLILKG